LSSGNPSTGGKVLSSEVSTGGEALSNGNLSTVDEALSSGNPSTVGEVLNSAWSINKQVNSNRVLDWFRDARRQRVMEAVGSDPNQSLITDYSFVVDEIEQLIRENSNL